MDIPGYHIERELSQNTLYTLYLATQKDNNKQVVIKVISSSLSSNKQFCQTFLKRAARLQAIQHPHCIRTYNVGVQDGGLCYLVLEYFPNGSLKKRLLIGLSPKQSIQLAIEVASALDYLHSAEFFHQSLHPDNIFLRDDGSAVISEADVIKDIAKQMHIHIPPAHIHNTQYISPEALQGSIQNASDFYSLGQLLYELLAKKLAFELDTRTPLTGKARCYQVLVDKLTDNHPENRIQSKQQLKEVLHHIENDNPSCFQKDNETLSEEPSVVPITTTDTEETAIPPTTTKSTHFITVSIGIVIITISALLSYYGIGYLFDDKIVIPKRQQLTQAISPPPQTEQQNTYTEQRTVIPPSVLPISGNDNDEFINDDFTDNEINTILETQEKTLTHIPSNRDNNIHTRPQPDPDTINFDDKSAASNINTATTNQLASVAIQPPLTTEQKKIQALLQHANQQIKKRKLTTPQNDNAYSTLQEVLKRDPDNQTAHKYLNKMAMLYFIIARKHATNNANKAIAYLDKALLLTPDNTEILALRKKIRDTIQQQRNQRIKQLYSQSEKALESMQLVPAYQYYQKLSAIAPNQVITKKLLKNIADTYIHVAKTWEVQGSYDDALNLIQEGLLIAPNYDALKKMEIELNTLIKEEQQAVAITAKAKKEPLIIKDNAIDEEESPILPTPLKEETVSIQEKTELTTTPPIQNIEDTKEEKEEKKKIRHFGTF